MSFAPALSEVSNLRLTLPKPVVNNRQELERWDDLETAIRQTGITTVRVTTKMQLKEVLMLSTELKRRLTVRTNNEDIKQELRNAVSQGTIDRAQQVLGRSEPSMLVQQTQEIPPVWEAKESGARDEKKKFADWIVEARARLANGDPVDAKIESLAGVRAHAKEFVKLLKDYSDRNLLRIVAKDELMGQLKPLLKAAQAALREENARETQRLAYKIAPEPAIPQVSAPPEPAPARSPGFFTRMGSGLNSMMGWAKKLIAN